ncbi:hypothetical protein Avbf_01729 [Armadillidium vulgare]|nr:hypothetical protein Avbf_01729 [Armadillidium vulgare]
MKVCCCFGRSGHQDVEEKDGKASVDIANVKNFENASTLPSCWSPPQQYNECSSNKSDISSSSYQDTHPLPSSSSSSSANEESKRSSSKGERAVEGKTYI